jgi:hypothetical protein
MLEVKMNMPEPPEGYEYTGEYRQAKKGETVLSRMVDKDILCTRGITGGSYPILRKVHREPELVYYMGRSGAWKTGEHNWRPEDIIGKRTNSFISVHGNEYEMFVVMKEEHRCKPKTSICLGHWNDGPKCDHRTETDTGTIVQKKGICQECGQLVQLQT